MTQEVTRENRDEFTRVTFFVPVPDEPEENAVRRIIDRLRRPMVEADQLYHQYGEPLETEHRGKYAAISEKGEIIIGAALQGVSDNALLLFGTQRFIFTVGDRRPQNPEVVTGFTHSDIGGPLFTGNWWFSEERRWL